jgi:hypothetical protein
MANYNSETQELENEIISRFRQKTVTYIKENSYDTLHANDLCKPLLQKIIDVTFSQKNGIITPTLYRILLSWIEKWFFNHYSSHVILSEKGVVNLSHSFIATLWTFLFNTILEGNIQFEIKGTYLTILKNPMLEVIDPENTRNPFGIQIDQLSDTNLVHLYIIHQIKPLMFRTKNDNTTHCIYNTVIDFDGSLLLKHILLMMVSGIEKSTYKEALFIYETIRDIIKKLYPILIENAFHSPTELSEPEIKYLQKLREKASHNKFNWLKIINSELKENCSHLTTNPKRILNIIHFHCSCRLSDSKENCCCICHNHCSIFVNNSSENFYNKLGHGKILPNLFFKNLTQDNMIVNAIDMNCTTN